MLKRKKVICKCTTDVTDYTCIHKFQASFRVRVCKAYPFTRVGPCYAIKNPFIFTLGLQTHLHRYGTRRLVMVPKKLEFKRKT